VARKTASEFGTTDLIDGVELTASAVEGVNASAVIDTHRVSWSVNPYGWAVDADTPAAAVVTLDLVQGGTSDVIAVKDLDEPLTLEVPITADDAGDEFACSYWDNATMQWSSAGLVVVGFLQDNTTGDAVAVCGALHLSDFSGNTGKSFMQVNTVDPIGDAGALASLTDESSALPLAVVAAVLGCALVSWIIAVRMDDKVAGELHALRRAHLLEYGSIKVGFGMELLHVNKGDAARQYIEKIVASLKVCLAEPCRGCARSCVCVPVAAFPPSPAVRVVRVSLPQASYSRGLSVLVSHYLALQWWRKIRSDHPLLSVLYPPLEEVLRVSRPQRVLTVCLAILANMAVSALFFGTDPTNIAQVAIASVVSAAAMLPFDMLAPKVFEAINCYKSFTVKMREVMARKYKRMTQQLLNKRSRVLAKAHERISQARAKRAAKDGDRRTSAPLVTQAARSLVAVTGRVADSATLAASGTVITPKNSGRGAMFGAAAGVSLGASVRTTAVDTSPVAAVQQPAVVRGGSLAREAWVSIENGDRDVACASPEQAPGVRDTATPTRTSSTVVSPTPDIGVVATAEVSPAEATRAADGTQSAATPPQSARLVAAMLSPPGSTGGASVVSPASSTASRIYGVRLPALTPKRSMLARMDSEVSSILTKLGFRTERRDDAAEDEEESKQERMPLSGDAHGDADVDRDDDDVISVDTDDGCADEVADRIEQLPAVAPAAASPLKPGVTARGSSRRLRAGMSSMDSFVSVESMESDYEEEPRMTVSQWHGPLLVVASILMAFVGVVSVVLGVFYAVTGVTVGNTVVITVVVGFCMSACALIAFVLVRQEKTASAFVLFALAVVCEGAGAAALLVLRPAAYDTALMAIGGAHGGAVLASLVAVLCLWRSRRIGIATRREEAVLVRNIKADTRRRGRRASLYGRTKIAASKLARAFR
jgi:hypothetical protein